jgi:hypothetical protein
MHAFKNTILNFDTARNRARLLEARIEQPPDVMSDVYTPLIANVICRVSNFHYVDGNQRSEIENNPANLIWVAYPSAFGLALRRYNFITPDQVNSEYHRHHPTATVFQYIQDEVVEGQLIVQHTPNRTPNKIVSSKVKVYINGMPIMTDADAGITNRMYDIYSDNVNISSDNNLLTVRKLYTTIARKFFYGQVGFNVTNASGFQVSFPQDTYANDITVQFSFMFYRRQGWVPVDQLPPMQIAPGSTQDLFVMEEEEGVNSDLFVQDNNQNGNNFNDNPMPENALFQLPAHLVQPRRSVRSTRYTGTLSVPTLIQQAFTRPQSQISQSQVAAARNRIGNNPAPARKTNVSGKIGADDTSDVVANIEPKIWIRKNIDDYFKHSKACIAVPQTEEEICFPMAFMRAQLRTWYFKINAETNKIENEFCNIIEGGTIEIEALNSNFKKLLLPFYDGVNINVFASEKQKYKKGSHGKFVYVNEKTDLSQEEIDWWKWCAWQVHYFVEGVCDREVDVHSLDDCLACYSYAFEVNIGIYAMEMKGERIMLECFKSIEKTATVKFIGLLIQNSHVHAIAHMREFQHSEIAKCNTCIHSYCDFGNHLNTHWDKSYKHMNSCYTKDWQLVPSLETMHQEEMDKMSSKIRFYKLKPEERIREMCKLCFKEVKNCDCNEKWCTVFTKYVQCSICNDIVPYFYFNTHYCFMKARSPKKRLNDLKIFVFDIESMQIFNEESKLYVHECILVCLKCVYSDEKWMFQNIQDFVHALVETKRFHGSRILAHNAGGYDLHFVSRYLEDNGIVHTIVPRPNTLNKYLMLEISMSGEKTAIRFLDFMMMMTDSLKNIGEAFKLNVCKGEFPHNFSIPSHLNYEGPIPALDAPEDWYGFKGMKEKDLHASKKYWEEQQKEYCTCYFEEMCICGRKKWSYKKALEHYCWLDVEVLSEACKAYRQRALEFGGTSEYDWSTNGIEPFEYMTQSQIALALFLEGKVHRDIFITHEKIGCEFDPKQIEWMEHLMFVDPSRKIQHAGNSVREYYDVDTRSFVDGYCHATREVFEYFDCVRDGCYLCYKHEIDSKQIHFLKNTTWDKVYKQTQLRITQLRSNNYYSDVIVRWKHEDVVYPELQQKPSIGNLMRLRDCFYGGRTEVFAAYANPSKFGPDMQIKHYDVCSLYPYVCSHKELPIGIPEIYFNFNIDKSRLHPNHPQRYFGFVRARVRPNPHDLIAILPHRSVSGDTEKLVYDLLEKEGCWHTELVYLAMEHQYEILEIYEIWHWPESQRSKNLMKGYMEFFLRMKQESEGWCKLGKSLFPTKQSDKDFTEEEIDAVVNMIFENNGNFARPRKEKVEKNPVLRQLAKIFLNCLWGKLCQKETTEYEKFIYGYKQYLEISTNAFIDQETIKFRRVNNNVFKVRYKINEGLKDFALQLSKYINIPIAASVTAHAQVHLMRQMFVVGPERMIYCDTDSIVCLRLSNEIKLSKSGLGQWEDEHPDDIIEKFYALAPKCYLELILDNKTKEVEEHLKCKGVRATLDNKAKVNEESFRKLIEQEYLKEILLVNNLNSNTEKFTVQADIMTIFPNSTNAYVPYGMMCTRYNKKNIQPVFTKRVLEKAFCINNTLDQLDILRLTPVGFFE